MFKTTHNLMKLKVKITPQTPLLIASGKTFDVTSPDIQFIRIKTRQGETVYIPGSSLKGVLRGGLESLLSENDQWKTKTCCTSEKMCHDLYRDKKKQLKKEKLTYPEKLPYKDHCPVCRMFGSGDLASRLEVADVYPFGPNDSDEKKKEKIETLQKMVTSRSGIKIDRKTGKTSPGALFEYEILGDGELFGEFIFTNYELYQPGLLFMLFDLSNEGFLRYGHSKSRGLGVLNFETQSIKILQMGKLKGKNLKGVGILPSPKGEDSEYGFYMQGDDQIDNPDSTEENILYSTYIFNEKKKIDEVCDKLKAKIDTFLKLQQVKG